MPMNAVEKEKISMELKAQICGLIDDHMDDLDAAKDQALREHHKPGPFVYRFGISAGIEPHQQYAIVTTKISWATKFTADTEGRVILQPDMIDEMES